MIRISCQNPVFLINPKLYQNPSIMLLVLDGRVVRPQLSDLIALSERVSPLKIFNVSCPPVLSYDFCERYYAISIDGEIIDFFIAVRCRRCAACQCSYVSTLKQKLILQAQSSRRVPLFVTLTYNNEHLPSGRDVCVRDVQLFLKRLRKIVSRVSKVPLKYYVVSEYTPVTRRPHYHLVIFDFPYLSTNYAANQILRYHVFQFCWRDGSERLKFSTYKKKYPLVFNRDNVYDPYSLGYIDISDIKSSHCVKYLCKYMSKDVDDVLVTENFSEIDHKRYLKRSRYFRTDWHRRNFRISSQNLGVDFLRSIIQPDATSVTFTDWLSNQVTTFHLSSYFLNKVYLPYSKLIPVLLRRAALYAYLECYQLYACRNVSDYLKRDLAHTAYYISHNVPSSFLPDSVYYEPCYMDDAQINHSLHLIAHCVTVLYQYIMDVDFDSLLKMSTHRDLVFSKISVPECADYSFFSRQMEDIRQKVKLL